jgi:hypothetical protein
MSSSESNLTQLETFEQKMDEMYEKVKILLTGQTETRDKFLKEVRDKMDELTGYSERLTIELETMNKSAELLQGICEKDGYDDEYKNIIRA